MHVILIASTRLTPQTFHLEIDEDLPPLLDHLLPVAEEDMTSVTRSFSGDIKDFTHDVTDIDRLIEFSGRLCYRSEHRPNPATRKNSDYIANILAQEHFSVIEHGSATFLIQDVSRSLTHELVRHRHFSYSQVSQRFVPHGSEPIVFPPSLDLLGVIDREEIEDSLRDLRDHAEDLYESIFSKLREQGSGVKEARGAARAALLESTSTSIVVSGNMRSWREFVLKRSSPGADREIRELAEVLLDELYEIAPAVFADMVEEE